MTHVAIDIGASSGRLILSHIKEGLLEMEEVHRFANGFSQKEGLECWDVDHLLTEILKGLETIKLQGFQKITAGIDTWAVDYALLDQNGQRLREVASYRDKRTANTLDKISAQYSLKTIYQKTGIQFMKINTLLQLFEESKTLLDQTASVMLVPDYLGYRLTGRAVTEVTNASTMQMLNVNHGGVDEDLLNLTGARQEQFADLVQPGTELGELKKEYFPDYDLPDCKFYNVGSHDTASAIAGTPGEGDDWCYISSGTWSLLGVEVKQPIITEEAYLQNYTNEWGVFGTYRFLKNIMGMWVMQEVRRHLPEDYNFHQFVAAAESVEPYQQFVNINDDRFLNPDNMISELQEYCRETGQAIPVSTGEIARCVFNSLAASYAIGIRNLERMTDKKLNRLHIVGGGSHNDLLNQMTADLSRLTVYAGPSEATALGNLVVQLIASGKIADLNEGRNMIKRSYPAKTFYPKEMNEELYIDQFISISKN
ncbi:rhamnulokinase [Jeotgalibacillus malaysiensis]|uniref:rhamnulokinase n=1 Tax=Jeotgalibacillus malaysiensis TaxID=1508404 RepID=UPI00384DD6ED